MAQADGHDGAFARGRVFEAKGIRKAMGEVFRLALQAPPKPRINRIPPSLCTNCGKLNNGATGHGAAADLVPSPGDVALCKCGHIMVYGDRLKLRDPTSAECVEIAGDPDVLAAQKVLESQKWSREQTDAAFALADKIKPILAGQSPDKQGAALAELLSIFIAGHHPDLREEQLELLLATVRRLMPCNDPWREVE